MRREPVTSGREEFPTTRATTCADDAITPREPPATFHGETREFRAANENKTSLITTAPAIRGDKSRARHRRRALYTNTHAHTRTNYCHGREATNGRAGITLDSVALPPPPPPPSNSTCDGIIIEYFAAHVPSERGLSIFKKKKKNFITIFKRRRRRRRRREFSSPSSLRSLVGRLM